MRAHVVQLDIAWEDKDRNRGRAAELLDRAEAAAGDLVLLPEMFDTGFSFNISATSDTDGRTAAFLAELADDYSVTVIGGRTIAPCHRCRARNVATVMAPGQRLLAEYTKVHPFTLSGEDRSFEAGEDISIFRHSEFTVCPLVCYDLRFPELFREGLRRGADLFTVIACWPKGRQHHWRTLLAARAIENQAFVIGCNRTGSDPALEYAGGSVVFGPKGDVLGELGAEEAVLSVPIKQEDAAAWRAAFPAWKDARFRPR